MKQKDNKMNNDELFLTTEADAMFLRNQDASKSCRWEDDYPLRLLKMYGICPASACEVGGGTAGRLGALHSENPNGEFRCVEPSQKAIEAGKKRHPEICFEQATAATMQTDRTFEVVILSFVLMYVDRSLLLESITRTDRLIMPGGYLLLADFLPLTGARYVPYHHVADADVNVYKTNYAQQFLATGNYALLAMLTTDMREYPKLVPPGSDAHRQGFWLLRKSVGCGYAAGRAP